MNDFAAIDFETANSSRSSICSIGIVIVRERKICEKIYRLVRPYPNYYNYYNTLIHGLSNIDTDEEAKFPEVWSDIAPLLEGLPLIAHNAPFDRGCLIAAHEAFLIEYPNYQFFCTLQESRRQLPFIENHQLHTVSDYCGYPLENHHHALADAEACARIALKLF